MPRLPNLRLFLLLPALLAALMPPGLIAQDDPNHDAHDTPLGDLARTLRKKTPPSQDVIDDDNLTKVMERAESRHSPGSALKFLMAGESKGFQVATPDVTCSLSFTASTKSLLSGQYAQMELPPGEVLKLEGPATIEGDALIVSVHNRTDWHVSEVAVALTVVKKTEDRDAYLSNPVTPSGSTSYGSPKLLPVVAGTSPLESEVRPEKKPDLTVIYRMRAAASPSATTVFSAPLNLDLAADEEWHWAIVEARGYPPRSYAGDPPQMAAPESSVPTTSGPGSSPAFAEPQNSDAVPLPQSPQSIPR
jgi:hypothetical protein